MKGEIIMGLRAAVALVAFIVAAVFCEMAARSTVNFIRGRPVSYGATLSTGIGATSLGTSLALLDVLFGLGGWLLAAGLVLIGFGYLLHIRARAGAAGLNSAAVTICTIFFSFICAIAAMLLTSRF